MPSEKPITRKWVLYICEECGRPGHVFRELKPCDHGGRHHGKHGGPIEVMPVEDHLQALGEVEKERDQECEAATLWCQSSIAATVDLKAAEQKIQTITAGLEAEVDHLRERSRINRGIGGSEAAAEVAVAADRLQAILDQAETAGAG